MAAGPDSSLRMKTSQTTSLLLTLLSAGALPAETLQDRLDARKADFEKKASAEKIAGYEAGIAAVRKSGMLENALKAGDLAPDFTLQNATGEKVTLSAELKKGPVILTWYRGSWCPYCNLALIAYQENNAKFKAAGAQLLALTPEKPDKSLPTAEKHALDFEILTDLNNEVAEKYRIVFQMTPFVEEAMRNFANLKSYNGEDYDDEDMPLSATYIITPDRKIAWAFLDAEYRNRATPEQILSELKKLNSKD
ncbi:MAG: peroxiredoxin-like family protein [Verrucomicrobiales bacterium]